MKRTASFIWLLLITAISQARDPLHRINLPEPSASFDSIWVDYDITEDDKRGMRIHINFSAYGMKEMDAYVAIYFSYNDDIAGFLKDKNSKFNSTDGDVAVYRSIRPAYDPAVYNDLQMFMPYAELDLEPGVYDLSMDVKVIYKAGGVISRLTNYDFEYSKPGSPADVESEEAATATLEDMWVDYDVTEGGKKGMRIHVKCTVYNMLNIDGYIAIYFEKKDGDKLKSTTSGFQSKSGQLAMYKSIKPAYKEAVYKDVTFFMPYNEIKVGTGKTDLKMDVNIILKNGDMVKHLKKYGFWLEK